jgi:molecular chaperone DnaJ
MQSSVRRKGAAIMSKSYFAILGVAKDASIEEIRSAYRRLVKAYHPDHFKGGNAPFMQIQEAYAVLSENHKRREHQRALEDSAKVSINRPGFEGSATRCYPHSAPEPLIPDPREAPLNTQASFKKAFHPSNPSIEEILNRIIGRSTRQKKTMPAGTPDAIVEVPLTMRQLRRGGSVEVSVQTLLRCSACNGMGVVDNYRCTRCLGRGAMVTEVPVRISFPPGMTRADHTLKVPMHRFGIRDLNLKIVFRVKPEDPQ